MLDARRSQIREKKRVKSGADKLLFLVFLLLGAAGIVWLKHEGFSQLWVTLWPCSLLFAYLGSVFLVERFRLREDQTADNLYYLGFLYTLTSLALSLVEFSTGEAATESIIQNFGIAISSTIVGLGLRVFVNQFRRDPVEIEREARVELASAASRLRAELDGAVLDFNSFRRAVQQSVIEAFEAASKRADEAFAGNAERIGAAAAQVVEKINEAFDSFQVNVRRLNEISSDTVRAVEELLARVEAIEAPADLLVSKLAPTIDALREAADTIKSHADAEEREVRRIARVVDKAIKAAEHADERLDALSDQSAKVAEIVQSLTRAHDGLQSGVAALKRGAEEQTRLLREAAEAAAAQRGASEAAFAALRTAAEENLALVRRHNEMMERELARAVRATARVETSLASALDAFATRVEREDQQEVEPGTVPRFAGEAGR